MNVLKFFKVFKTKYDSSPSSLILENLKGNLVEFH